MTGILTAVLFFGVPALLMVAAERFDILKKLGPVVLCYLVGLLIGIFELLPASGHAMRTTATEVSLALALPLLLFSVNLLAWRRIAGRALLSMLFAVVSVIFITVLLFFAFNANGVAQAEQLTGMAIGMYTGGIANLGAIKIALAIPDARYLLFASVDTVVGAAFLLFVLTRAQTFFLHFLPAFDHAHIDPETPESQLVETSRNPVIDGILALVCAGLCVGGAVLVAPMLPFVANEIAVITLLTSFGLAMSFIPHLRRNEIATIIGMYLIYVFSFCVAASLDLGALLSMDLSILVFIVAALFGSLTLHAFLCRLARIDTDTFLVTSVAAIMSPAFVPMVVRSLGNPSMMMSGMTTGLLGFAIGNYLGIAIALLLS